MTTKINVDFNSVQPDGRVHALTSHAEGVVLAGALVILADGDGNVVQARVLSILNDLVTLEVDWATWNRVNTLFDSLDVLIERIGGASASLNDLFEPSPSGYDLPERKVEITA
jgi:hypothetical protein